MRLQWWMTISMKAKDAYLSGGICLFRQEGGPPAALEPFGPGRAVDCRYVVVLCRDGRTNGGPWVDDSARTDHHDRKSGPKGQ